MQKKEKLVLIIAKGEFDETKPEVRAAFKKLQKINEKKCRKDTRRFYRVNGKPKKKKIFFNIIFD